MAFGPIGIGGSEVLNAHIFILLWLAGLRDSAPVNMGSII
jgi:hypothetical protein